ncbi:MAG: mechanosensitive ion channel family protein [Cyanobacteria bacterium J083]|nr:MAG: mechanosensitive ion channel family protein [Cyanobacteria bacterium J083]
MQGFLNTIVTSIQELIASGIKLLPALLSGLVIIFLTRYAAQFTQQLVDKIVKTAITSRSLQILFVKIAQVTTWGIGILFACVVAFPGFDLGDIIATLGLTSVAIGFAFQEILKNFLAGVLLLLQEPFKIGDEVNIDGYEGIVENISIRSTSIRTYQGEKVLVPNAKVFTSNVQVRTAYVSRRTDLQVGVDYNTDLEQARQILDQTIKKIAGVVKNPEPEIDLVSFGDSSIDFIVRYWTLPQEKEVRNVRTKAIVGIKRAFDQADIVIPYPIRTLYYYNQEKFNDFLPLKEQENGKLVDTNT